ncbi:hypothetical protein [Streptomyces sp. BH055]|uniref:hypothetical protein n=1 Tax=Streptomyces sp. BH055 TaxID=3401173 RepID=UPI003BB70D50
MRATEAMDPDGRTLATFDPDTYEPGDPLDAHDFAHQILDELPDEKADTSTLFALFRATRVVHRESFHIGGGLDAHAFAHEILTAVSQCVADGSRDHACPTMSPV